MIVEQNDVELISMKTKSLQDIENDVQIDYGKSRNSKNSYNIPIINKTNDNEFSVDNDVDDDDHFESCVHFLKIDKSPNGACGFHLTRTKWDPYPWVSAVDNFTPAKKCGLKAGDCVLEVNGCDVLGLRITEIAKLVKSSQHQVTLLLWSTKCNTKCEEESLCAAPMPRSLQRLSMVVQTVLSVIECPVCLDTITPPAMQCQNGHLLCVNCRIRAEKCPVCRDRYFPRPALIAEQIQSAITSAFNLCRNEDKVRRKIFGRHNRQRQMVKTTLESFAKNSVQEVHKSLTTDSEIIQNTRATTTTRQADVQVAVATTPKTATINRICDRKEMPDIFKKPNTTTKNAGSKLLTKLLNSKAYSMENLTNGHNTTTTTTRTTNNFNTSNTPTIMSAISQPQLFAILQQQQCSHAQAAEGRASGKTVKEQHQTSLMEQYQLNTNQFKNFPTNAQKTHLLTYKPNFNGIENDFNINSNPCCKQMLNNKMKHLSISSKDLTRTTQNVSCLLESATLFMMKNAQRPCPVVCETSYQTIPRAIKVKKETHSTCSTCQRDKSSITETSTNSTFSSNSLKSFSSSTTSLNLTPNLCTTLSSSSSSFQNCQSLLSSSSSSSSSPTSSPATTSQ